LQGIPKGRTDMATHEERQERLALRDDIAAYTAVSGVEYAYRPGQVICAIEDEPLVGAALAEVGAEPASDELPGVLLYRAPDDLDIPALVERLRSTEGERAPRVGPNHVVFGVPAFRGSPGDEPERAEPLGDPPEGDELPGHGVDVVVLDTGVDAGARKTAWLQPALVASGDIDLSADLLPSDGFIDEQAGHGAFVAGLVRQAAPGATVRVVRVLDTQGVGDEVAIAAAIVSARSADVLNLSLGGYAHGDLPPIAIEAALASLPRSTAVVAAAGNFGATRPFWPAALKRAIAVGAVDEHTRPASFTNRGWWVDACALGVKCHSVFVRGTENPALAAHPEVFDGWALWSGTSFACAVVAGAVAAEQSSGGGTARQAADRLLGDPSRTVLSGLGVLLG
jgi:subtilisin family serine protease